MNTKKNLPVLLSFSLAVLLYSYPAISEAATYYVSNSGSATWTQCTNIGTPCAVQTAFNNAVAGDIVYFRGGTYNVPAKNFSDPYHGYYEPANSGTAGNPITFAAYSGETPIFNGTAGGTGDVPEFATIFGTFGRSYIVFDGFTLQANNGTKMARIHIGSDAFAIISYGITLKNCSVNGGSTIITNTDNREGIRVDHTEDTLIQRCRVFNFRESNNKDNTAGYKGYNNKRLIIENSEFYNNTIGVFWKREHIDSILRYNYIHNNYMGFFVWTYNAGTQYNTDNMNIYHNVIANNTYSSLHIFGQDGAHADNSAIYNNTIYCANGVYGIIYTEGVNWKLWNNIIQGCGGRQYTNGYANVTIAESDYNQFGNATFTVVTHLYNNAKTYSSLSAWQASTEIIGGLHPDTHSLASNPLFQNGSGNMSQLNDFRLANNSSSKGTGKGGLDMGANIDNVGTGGSSGDTQSPTVPAGLSAQAVSSSQINLSWTAATDNVGVTGYRVYRNGTQIATSPTNSYSNTGLSASTVYTYSVSAYDAANNVSAQSVSATATTVADTGGSNQNSGGNDSSASGGSGCGFVKEDGKGQGAKGEGLSFAIMLIIALKIISVTLHQLKRRKAL